MDAELIFRIANSMALAGWLALLASPLAPRLAQAVSGLAIPLLLAVAYSGLIMAFWSSGQGGFDSLAHVAQLFQSRQLLLAGWVHYLAFDLFVGAWIAETGEPLESLPSAAPAPQRFEPGAVAQMFGTGPTGHGNAMSDMFVATLYAALITEVACVSGDLIGDVIRLGDDVLGVLSDRERRDSHTVVSDVVGDDWSAAFTGFADREYDDEDGGFTTAEEWQRHIVDTVRAMQARRAA